MPLIQGKSKKAFSSNVGAEMDSGKPQKQALAIAYNVMRKNRAKKMAAGGEVEARHKAMSMDQKDWQHMNEFADGGDIQNEKLHPEHEPPMRMMSHPAHIAHMVMKKMAAGGMYPQEKDASYAEGGMAKEDETHGTWIGNPKQPGADSYADGGIVDDMDGESEDMNSEAESLPFEDEDKVDIPPLGYDSAREDVEGVHDRKNRRGMLSEIMRRSRP